MLIEMLTLLAAAGAPLPADRSGLFKDDDYPASAVETNQQGKTTIRVNVAADGTPTACKVVKSSRSAALDIATCDVVLKRGHFVETAKQHEGKPFLVEWSIGWQLAPFVTPFDVDHHLIIYALSNGSINGCRSEVATRRAPYPNACDDHRPSAQAALDSLRDE